MGFHCCLCHTHAKASQLLRLAVSQCLALLRLPSPCWSGICQDEAQPEAVAGRHTSLKSTVATQRCQTCHEVNCSYTEIELGPQGAAAAAVSCCCCVPCMTLGGKVQQRVLKTASEGLHNSMHAARVAAWTAGAERQDLQVQLTCNHTRQPLPSTANVAPGVSCLRHGPHSPPLSRHRLQWPGYCH